MRIPVDLVVLATGMVPNSADGMAIRALRDAGAQSAAQRVATNQRQAAEKIVEEYKHHEGTEILNLTYRQGPDLPGAARRFPRFEFHLLPLRDAAHGNLRGGRGARADGFGAGGRRCLRRRDEGDPEHRTGDPRAGRPSARRRSFLPQLLSAALHVVQALHRGVPLRLHRRGREGHAQVQPVSLPALRHLHGRLSRSASFRSRTTRWT